MSNKARNYAMKYFDLKLNFFLFFGGQPIDLFSTNTYFAWSTEKNVKTFRSMGKLNPICCHLVFMNQIRNSNSYFAKKEYLGNPYCLLFGLYLYCKGKEWRKIKTKGSGLSVPCIGAILFWCSTRFIFVFISLQCDAIRWEQLLLRCRLGQL